MKKKGVVFLAAALGLVFMGQFGLIKAGPRPQSANVQSAEANVLAERQFAEAVTLLKQENFADAIAAYEKVIRLLPESPIAQDARYWIGQTHLRMGKYDEALAVFKRLLKDHPGSPIVPVTRLMVARAEKEKEDANQRTQAEGAPELKLITDPSTGARYTKVAELRGKKAVVVFGLHNVSLAPNGKFLLYNRLVIPLDEHEPFTLPGGQYDRHVVSPDGKKVAYITEGAIWILPISPETGRPAGKAKKVLDYPLKNRQGVSWSPDSKRITFEWGENEKGGDVWTLSIEDGALKQLTDDPVWEARPIWSGDGKTIAYNRGTRELDFVSAEGGTPRKIMDNAHPYAWSPDGEWLFYLQGIRPRLYRTSDGRVFEIAPPQGVGDFLSWSADGKTMFFYRSSYDYAPAAKVVSTQGGPTFQLGRGLPLWPYVHFWSPDSRMIITSGGAEWDLYLMPIAGGQSTILKLDVSDGTDFGPRSVSPDGKKLLMFVPQGKGKEDLYVAPLSLKEGRTTGPAVKVFSGRDKKPVFTGKRDEWDWSPDGKRLALVHGGDIWVVSTDKGEPVRITADPEDESYPVWSPDGKTIAFVQRQNTAPGDRSLCVVSSMGGGPRKIWDGCGKEEFTWSLDGKEILVDSEGFIHAVPLSGGKSRQLLDLKKEGLKGDPPSAMGLCWLPGGKKLAFMSSDEEAVRIFLVSPNGGGLTELASDDPDEKDWIYPSPDGQWISYVTEGFVKVRPSESIWEVKLEDLIREKK
jgi:Tol biopolymer transport system component